MSKRAEEAALKAYPKEIRDKNGIVIDIGHPQWIRDYYIESYEQAEKDLALTADDMKLIHEICTELTRHTEWPLMGQDAYYEEVLRRFNEKRKEK